MPWYNLATGVKTHKRVMRVIRGLGDKNTVRRVRGLDEAMRAYVNHDLGAGQNLDHELLLQLMELLQSDM